MSLLSKQLTPGVLAKLGGLSLMSRMAASGIMAGLHKSVSKGGGSDFLQYRPYTPGDDLRYTDWKLYARRDKLYQKECREDTTMRCAVLLDSSASMAYKGDDSSLSKYEYGILLAACYAQLAASQNDNVSVFTMSETDKAAIPYRGLDSMAQLVGQLENISLTSHVSPDGALLQANDFLGESRGMLIIISDLLEWNVVSILRKLTAVKRDVRICHILDSDEISLPYSGTLLFKDAEKQDSLLTAPDVIRDVYSQRLHAWLASVRESALSCQVCYHFSDTQASLLDFFPQ